MADRKAWAQQMARDLLAEQGIVSPPVHVDRVAKQCGITVQYAPLDDELSGMAFVKDGVPVIGVNALHHPNRQRFTVAHELGHHILHKEILGSSVHVDKVIMKRDQLAATGTDLNEIEANAFAAELLMPIEWISALTADGVDIGDETKISALAKKFKVSVAAIQFRLLS